MTSKTPPLYSKQAVSHYILSFNNPHLCHISNVVTKMDELSVSSSLALPITINDSDYQNSYVCSPYTALVPYCKEELEKVDSTFIQYAVNGLIYIFDIILKKSKINKICQVNNWLLSTNLFPASLKKTHINESKKTLVANYPTHLLMYRSLNYYTNRNLIEYFLELGFELIPTRQVYIFDKRINDFSKTHNYKMDRKLLNKTDYCYVPQNKILPSDIPRIVELYNALYIEKYSQHNPKFTHSYIEMIIEHPNFYIEGFRGKNGVLDAVGGRFEMDGTVTLPIVGYDTNKPTKLGLYRLLVISTMQYTEDKNLIFNASSGASKFKLLRGATPYIEYSAIYSKHLLFGRRLIWQVLQVLLKHIFIPIVKRYKL